MVLLVLTGDNACPLPHLRSGSLRATCDYNVARYLLNGKFRVNLVQSKREKDLARDRNPIHFRFQNFLCASGCW